MTPGTEQRKLAAIIPPRGTDIVGYPEASAAERQEMFALVLTALQIRRKWSARRILETFLSECPKAKEAVVVCRTPRPLKLAPKITAVPWQEIPTLLARVA